MAAIHDLIAQIGDERLRERLSAEWARATRERKFGLVFEEHLPELLSLPKAKPRKGDLVAARAGSLKDLWRVVGTKGGRLQCVRPQAGEQEQSDDRAEFDVAEVIVVREFGEPDVLTEELARGDVVGWLRNLPNKPWSLEIPYETGGDVRPMFPDFVIVRTTGKDHVVDILEPHDPSRDDNVDKARGLARFAERHGALFGRIQMIRKRKVAGGAEQLVRLEINNQQAIQKLLLVNQASQLDALFDGAP